jgi:ribosomal protein S18 acetylase RimI-like enzyme
MSDDLHRAGLASIGAFCKASLGRRGLGVVDDGRVVLCAGRTPAPGPWTNSAVRVDPDLRALDAFAAATDFFGSLGHGFAFWTDGRTDGDLDALLESRRATPNEDAPAPGMVVDAPVATSSVASQVSAVADQRELDELCEVVGISYGFGSGIRGVLGDWPIAPAARAYVLRDRESACASAVGIRDLVGGVYMVGTRPESRSRGYGEAVTAAATNDLFAAGATSVVLQASAMGAPIYGRMGYRTFTTYRRWLVPPPVAAA